MMQARRENASYTQLVETGKKLDKIEQRKKKQSGKNDEVDLGQKKKRRPRQVKPMEEGTDKAAKKAVLRNMIS